MLDKKEIKHNRLKRAFKLVMIASVSVVCCCIIFIGYMLITKFTTGSFPTWLQSNLAQFILLETEAEANTSDDLIVPIQPEPVIIYKNPYKHTKDMHILSLYIRSRVKNTPIELADRIAYEVCKQSKDKGIPFEVTVGIIETESMWNPRAKSKKDARGLMQALREDGIEIDKEKLYGVEYNIDIGLQILVSKIKRCKGSLSNALYCYVGGDEKYKDSVYGAMGKFLLFKITYVEES